MKADEIIGVNIGDWAGIHLHRLIDKKYIDCNKKDFDLLLSEGWIEEVKPRELYISKSFLDDYGRVDKLEFFRSDTREDLVKVRVID